MSRSESAGDGARPNAPACWPSRAGRPSRVARRAGCPSSRVGPSRGRAPLRHPAARLLVRPLRVSRCRAHRRAPPLGATVARSRARPAAGPRHRVSPCPAGRCGQGPTQVPVALQPAVAAPPLRRAHPVVARPAVARPQAAASRPAAVRRPPAAHLVAVTNPPVPTHRLAPAPRPARCRRVARCGAPSVALRSHRRRSNPHRSRGPRRGRPRSLPRRSGRPGSRRRSGREGSLGPRSPRQRGRPDRSRTRARGPVALGPAVPVAGLGRVLRGR